MVVVLALVDVEADAKDEKNEVETSEDCETASKREAGEEDGGLRAAGEGGTGQTDEVDADGVQMLNVGGGMKAGGVTSGRTCERMRDFGFMGVVGATAGVEEAVVLVVVVDVGDEAEVNTESSFGMRGIMLGNL